MSEPPSSSEAAVASSEKSVSAAYILNLKGSLHFRDGQYTEAKEAFDKALEAAATPSERAWALSNLGTIEDAKGNYNESKELQEKALALLGSGSESESEFEAVPESGEERIKTKKKAASAAKTRVRADVRVNLGAAHTRLKSPHARSFYERAVQQYRLLPLHEADNAEKLATALTFIARSFMEEEEKEKEEEHLTEALKALESAEEVLRNTPTTSAASRESQRLNVLELMVSIMERRSRWDEAIALLERIRSGWETLHGKQSSESAVVDLAIARINISKAISASSASVKQQKEQPQGKAGEEQRETSAEGSKEPLGEAKSGDSSGQQIVAAEKTDECAGTDSSAASQATQKELSEEEKKAEAEARERTIAAAKASLHEALRHSIQATLVLQKKVEMSSKLDSGVKAKTALGIKKLRANLSQAHKLQGRCYLFLGHAERANAQFRLGGAILEKDLSDEPSEYAHFCSDIAQNFEALNFRRLAIEWHERHVTALEELRALAKDMGMSDIVVSLDDQLGLALFAIASHSIELGDSDRAREFFRKTYKVAQNKSGMSNQALGCLKIRIGESYRMAGRHDEAIDVLNEAVKLLKEYESDLQIAQKLLDASKKTLAERNSHQKRFAGKPKGEEAQVQSTAGDAPGAAAAVQSDVSVDSAAPKAKSKSKKGKK